MIAEFMHYYGYRLEETLEMYALQFFALLSSMYRLNGLKYQEITYSTAVAFAGGDTLKEYMKNMEKQAKGAKGILDEVRIVRNSRNKK